MVKVGGVFGSIERVVGATRKGKDVGDSTVVTVTPLGSAKAEKFDLPGNKWRILSALQENGPSTVHELSEECRLSHGKTKAIVKKLIREQYVQKARATE